MANVRTRKGDDQESRNSLREALTLLKRLMGGERLSVRGLLASGEVPSDSTGRRYFNLLEELVPGVERVSGTRPAEWVYRVPDAPPPDRFTVLSLRLARCLLVFLRGSELDLKLEQLIRETQARLPADAAPFDVSRMFFSTVYRAPGVNPDTVDRVVKSIIETRRVQATYESFEGTVREVLLEPYSLIFSSSGLHCYGRCVESTKLGHVDKRRLHSLARFRVFKPTDERFTYPERDEYDPKELFKYCWGIFLPRVPDEDAPDVVLRFDAKWGHFLKTTPWHVTQSEPRRLKSGKFEVTMKLYQTEDLVQWIRGHGKDITVVKPPSLKKEVGRRDV